jgi:hypothetical protein
VALVVKVSLWVPWLLPIGFYPAQVTSWVRPLKTWHGWLAEVAVLGVHKATHSWVRVCVVVMEEPRAFHEELHV